MLGLANMYTVFSSLEYYASMYLMYKSKKDNNNQTETHKERDMYNNKVEGIVPCQFLLGMVCKGQVQSLQEIFFKIQKNMLHLL